MGEVPAVDAHDHICILPDAPCVTQVRQLRHGWLAALDGAAQPGQRDEEPLQIFAQDLQNPAEVDELLPAVVLATVGGEPLSVIDDPHRQATLLRYAVGLRADVQAGEAGRGVHASWRLHA